MKLAIFTQQKEPEQLIRLALVPCEYGDGSIGLICVDKDGQPIPEAKILFINPSGRLYLFQRIRKDLGFQLDMRGRIQVIDDPEG